MGEWYFTFLAGPETGPVPETEPAELSAEWEEAAELLVVAAAVFDPDVDAIFAIIFNSAFPMINKSGSWLMVYNSCVHSD